MALDCLSAMRSRKVARVIERKLAQAGPLPGSPQLPQPQSRQPTARLIRQLGPADDRQPAMQGPARSSRTPTRPAGRPWWTSPT